MCGGRAFSETKKKLKTVPTQDAAALGRLEPMIMITLMRFNNLYSRLIIPPVDSQLLVLRSTTGERANRGAPATQEIAEQTIDFFMLHLPATQQHRSGESIDSDFSEVRHAAADGVGG